MAHVNLDIVPESTLDVVLERFPVIENKLIEIAPTLVVLKNPVLRANISKVTTLKQAATIANLPLGEFINTLRKEAGLDLFEINKINSEELSPSWLNESKIVTVYDAREDLAKGMHPATKVLTESANLNVGEIFLLITNFVPGPLMARGESLGLKVFNKQLEHNKFGSYFYKPCELGEIPENKLKGGC